MVPADPLAHLQVWVAFSPHAGEVDEVHLSLSAGATVADALRESGLQRRHPALDLATAPIGIWGTLCGRETELRDRDRVEVYRALRVDPKEARHRRHRDHAGARRARLTR